jgi:opacity protein-like surface antigen
MDRMNWINRNLLLFVLLAMTLIAPAHASVADAPGANLQVSLITYGPGETYWERFGHDAIELRDSASGEAISFNYGVFDFNEANFFLNFARGRMHYLMDAAPSNVDESYYVEAGRSVTRQQLAMTAEQAGALRDFLLWNLRPENAGYNYDYYVDNCTTRVRDALDKALGGVIKTQLSARTGGMTFRQQTSRLMSAQAWLMLVMDLGLGPYADQPLSAWQESFLPEVLQLQLREVRVDNGHGGLQPLLQSEQLVSPNRLDVPPAAAPDLRLPLGLAGLSLGVLIVLTRRWWPLGYALLGMLYLLCAGIIGLVLLTLWTLTTHHSAWNNANLLLFNPLAFLLLPTLWRSRRGFAASRFMDGVIALQLLASMIAVLLHLLPGTVQQNQPWLLFALPCWLALAWSLRRNR